MIVIVISTKSAYAQYADTYYNASYSNGYLYAVNEVEGSMSGVGSNSYTHNYYVRLYITSPAGTGGTNDGSTEESFPASAAASVVLNDSIAVDDDGTYDIDIGDYAYCTAHGEFLSYTYAYQATPPVCPSTILYTQSVTPSLSNNPSYRTGMGIVAVMTGSAGSEGAEISEAVSLQSSTCGPNYQINCGGSPSVTIASGGAMPFQGTVLPAVTNGFYDAHEDLNTIDVLGTLGSNWCTFTCIQTYSCGGSPLGKFSIQYNLTHGSGVTNVTATKTATN